MKRILSLIICIIAMATSHAATWHVDPSSTSSITNGSLLNPWKTLAQVNSNQGLFQPGDQVLFRRGEKFSGNITITRSGTTDKPIVFGAYGSGADPLFYGTGSTITSLFYLYNRSNITFYGLQISDTTISATDRTVQSKIQRVFYVDGFSTNIVIRKCRIDRAGCGVYFVGPGNTVDSCDIGNMRMIRNTPTNVNNNDDYGANPVIISSGNNKVINNYFHDCWAMSYDYSYDGGAIEFFGDGSSNNLIAWNTFIDCNGVVEHGSSGNGTIANNLFAFNKCINNGSLIYINNGGAFTVTVTNLQFYNNTIIETVVGRLNDSHLVSMSTGVSTAGVVVFKNNIFWITNGVDVARSGQFNGAQLVHENNIYRLGSGSVLNYTLTGSEKTTTSNLFTYQTGAAETWYLRPTEFSPARSIGQNLSASITPYIDAEAKAVNNPPDAGAIQYTGPVSTPGRKFVIKGYRYGIELRKAN